MNETKTRMAKTLPTRARRTGWQFALHPGDEVTWNDPDAGLCSRTGIIAQIRWARDTREPAHVRSLVGWLTYTDGHTIEILATELS